MSSLKESVWCICSMVQRRQKEAAQERDRQDSVQTPTATEPQRQSDAPRYPKAFRWVAPPKGLSICPGWKFCFSTESDQACHLQFVTPQKDWQQLRSRKRLCCVTRTPQLPSRGEGKTRYFCNAPTTCCKSVSIFIKNQKHLCLFHGHLCWICFMLNRNYASSSLFCHSALPSQALCCPKQMNNLVREPETG